MSAERSSKSDLQMRLYEVQSRIDHRYGYNKSAAEWLETVSAVRHQKRRVS